MSSNSGRMFTDRPAIRERVPVLLGIVGASGSGKTFSALRLATGIQRVTGGDIWMIDTEARRGLHYAPTAGQAANPAAGTFGFRHLPFEPPFSPLDYLGAIEHCIKGGARTVIVDSMSHEHEGPGGVLEEHDREVERLMALWRVNSAEAVNIPAWAAPKAKRRTLINAILQKSVNFIFCFRAKEKVKVRSKKEKEAGDREAVKQLGFMPIAGDEFVYEMTLNCLLMPNSGGVPSWHPEEMGEKAIIKLPSQFHGIFQASAPLSEDIGQKLAEWAAGGEDASRQVNRAEIMVTSVSDKTVKRDGKSVVAYFVTAKDGRVFGTYDSAIAEKARNAREMDTLMRITWTVGNGGALVIETFDLATHDDQTAPLFGDSSAA